MSEKFLYRSCEAEMIESRLGQFVAYVRAHGGYDFDGIQAYGAALYNAVHHWSVREPEAFYRAVWDFCGLIGDQGDTVLRDGDDILEAQFFPDSQISFAENMLARVETHEDEPAIISRVAGVQNDRILSWQDVYNDVSRWVQILERYDVGEGDVVATYLPHIPEAYILMIACSQVGAVFCSVGTEMGEQASVARFAQVQPKILIAVDGYIHRSTPDKLPKTEGRIDLITSVQKNVERLKNTIVISNLGERTDLSNLKNTVFSSDILNDVQPKKIEFVRRDFNAPLAILFSSGSSGAPKCFVHGVGGVLLKHAIEHQLQCDVRVGDRVFFHTTTSWMMFNWLASGLAQGATILIYDGNPAYPAADAQIAFAAEYGATHLGTAAAVISDVWAKNKVRGDAFDLSPLQRLMYTGSVLSDAGFDYVHGHIKGDMHIEGVCGGTDFVGCYAMGNPFMPTLSGHLKGGVLGMDIDVWNDGGESVGDSETGELVVKSTFSSRPLKFLNDPQNKKFRAEYFEYFDCDPLVWRHGDAVRRSKGQLVVEGRSDSTLNQGGVRIGTQQLYDALEHENLRGVVVDSLAASFKDDQGGDHTALFLVLGDGVEFDEDLKSNIKRVISDSVGRLCCPHEIWAVPYVLKTPNGKKAEKPTAMLLAGKDVAAVETYGEDKGGLKTGLFEEIGEELRGKW